VASAAWQTAKRIGMVVALTARSEEDTASGTSAGSSGSGRKRTRFVLAGGAGRTRRAHEERVFG
jgi:hypothetical protein